jgi:hypothetical protein
MSRSVAPNEHPIDPNVRNHAQAAEPSRQSLGRQIQLEQVRTTTASTTSVEGEHDGEHPRSHHRPKEAKRPTTTTIQSPPVEVPGSPPLTAALRDAEGEGAGGLTMGK